MSDICLVLCFAYPGGFVATFVLAANYIFENRAGGREGFAGLRTLAEVSIPAKAPEPADTEKSGRELRKERKAAKKAAKKQAKLERRQARKHRGDAEPEIPAEDLDENEKTEQTPPETPDGETKEN